MEVALPLAEARHCNKEKREKRAEVRPDVGARRGGRNERLGRSLKELLGEATGELTCRRLGSRPHPHVQRVPGWSHTEDRVSNSIAGCINK
jgi:hypothetical protein